MNECTCPENAVGLGHTVECNLRIRIAELKEIRDDLNYKNGELHEWQHKLERRITELEKERDEAGDQVAELNLAFNALDKKLTAAMKVVEIWRESKGFDLPENSEGWKSVRRMDKALTEFEEKYQ